MFLLNALLSFRVTPEYEQVATASEVVKVNDGRHTKVGQLSFEIQSAGAVIVNPASMTTVESVLIASDRQVNIFLNDSLVAIPAKTLLLDATAVTEITVVNPGAITAIVRVTALGS